MERTPVNPKTLVLAAAAMLAAAAAVAAWFAVRGGAERTPVVVVTAAEPDPFRREVCTAVMRTVMERCDLEPEQLKRVRLPWREGGPTTDDVGDEVYAAAEVAILLLPPGKRRIEASCRVIVGPLRECDRAFADENPEVSFLFSDSFLLPLAETLAALGAPPRPLALCASERAGGRRAFASPAGIPGDTPFLGPPGEADLSRLEGGSVVLLACEEADMKSVEALAARLAGKGCALVTDRAGYLGCGAVAEISPDPQAAGEVLGRLAARALLSGRSPEVRTLVVLRRRYRPDLAAKLGLRVDQTVFTPVP